MPMLHEKIRMRENREGKVREEISPFPLLPFCFYITSTLLASSGFNKKGNYANYFRIDSRALLRGGGCRGEGVEADNASRMRVELKGMRKGVVCVGENVG